ncbi:hypothetical protein GYMLUDRAFT_269924 [Collybiopsis luxurians FD-317 M1]|nr:hypothetical protein GYMLUDRAFT_269924 [Collybiopsis luxurians FD-317 M1]
MSSTNMPESTEDADSSLQTTIQRLDQAFERIRNLRRDILQEQANRISPGHEAILLTGHEGYQDDLERIRTVIPADTRERLRQFESRGPEADRERDRSRARSHLLRAAAAHMYPLDTSVTPSSSHPSSAQSPLSFASPLSPPRQRLLPHRLLDTVTQPLRRRESSDDPNTELGRRIFGAATRESARDTITHNSSPDGPHRLPTVIERDFEYASRTRLRRSEPAFARRVEISLDQLRQEVENRVSRSLDAVGASASSSAESSARHTNSRSNRTSRSRQSSNPSTNLSSATSTQSRLSLLSNFPVQNFPTPSSTLSNPPLLFEEPTSYVHDERMQSINEEQQRALEDHYPFQVRMGWDGRADQDLLFTSSPVQMHHESEVVRTGYNRDNTIQMPGGSSQCE